jgi:hypothetical protein
VIYCIETGREHMKKKVCLFQKNKMGSSFKIKLPKKKQNLNSAKTPRFASWKEKKKMDKSKVVNNQGRELLVISLITEISHPRMSSMFRKTTTSPRAGGLRGSTS